MIRILLLVLTILCCPLNVYADDEFGTAWHNPDEYDSISGEEVHIKSEWAAANSEGKGGTTSRIREKIEITDKEGTRLNVTETETHHPDGSVDSHTEITHTNKYGDQTVETSSRHYNKNGNLINETSSSEKNAVEKPHSTDDGLQYEGIKNQESPAERASAKITVGGDKIKIEQPDLNLDKITDLGTDKTYYIDHNKKEYRLAGIDICRELAPLARDYKKFLPQLADTIEYISNNPLVPLSEKNKLGEAAEKLRQVENYEEPKPADLTYDKTRKLGLFAGQIGEQILAKDKNGKIVQEFWLAKTIVPIGIMRPKKFSPKARKTMLEAGAHLTPELRRLFSHLVLKTVSYFPWGPGNSFEVKEFKRIKVRPDDFLPPGGYAKGASYDAKEIESLIRETNKVWRKK